MGSSRDADDLRGSGLPRCDAGPFGRLRFVLRELMRLLRRNRN